jgi:uncharacterized glyoxalase superfamily protein PhnB
MARVWQRRHHPRTRRGLQQFVDVVETCRQPRVRTVGVMPIPAVAQLVSRFSSDHEALARFYVEAFGFSVVEEVASPIFVALDAGGVALGFHADEAHELLGIGDRRGAADATHITFDLGTAAQVDAAIEPLVALGATLVQGPFTTYYDARQAVLADPEGNIFRISDTQTPLVLPRQV